MGVTKIVNVKRSLSVEKVENPFTREFNYCFNILIIIDDVIISLCFTYATAILKNIWKLAEKLDFGFNWSFNILKICIV